MDKLLKVDPGFADKDFIYQKEILQKKLKKSDLDIDEDTFINYLFFRLAEMQEGDKTEENEEVITTGILSLHLSYCLYQG
jgi:hypothetical protein